MSKKKKYDYKPKPKAKIDFILKLNEVKIQRQDDLMNKYKPSGYQKTLDENKIKKELIQNIKQDLKKTKSKLYNDADLDFGSKYKNML